jgi:hypothetical protein
MMHLARRIVWSGHGPDDRVVVFRVTEDGTYANADDEPVSLEGIAEVRVPHPLRWPDGSLETWRTLFHDYELIQPYPQLGRSTPIVLDADLGTDVVKRRKGTNDVWDERRRLEARGYHPLGAQHSQWLEKSFDDGLKVRVHARARWEQGKYNGTDFDLALLRGEGPTPWRDAKSVLLTVLDELGIFEATT